MARMSSATSTKKADPTGPLRRSRPNRTPGGRRRAGMLSRRLYDGVGESLDHRGARTLLVVKPESPRELSSALPATAGIATLASLGEEGGGGGRCRIADCTVPASVQLGHDSLAHVGASVCCRDRRDHACGDHRGGLVIPTWQW